MSNSAQSRRFALLLPLGLLMLSMAVFGWGLQYKLSLYQSKNAAQRRTPEAKLLSQRERPAAIQMPNRSTETPAWPAVWLVAIAFSLYQGARPFGRAAGLDVDWSPQPSSYRRIFVRPPPRVSFSY